MDTDAGTWAQVVSRMKKRAARPAATAAAKAVEGRVRATPPVRDLKVKLLQKRKPTGGAVIISHKSGTTPYTEIIRIARSKVSPGTLGLKAVKVRATKKGEMLIELQGGMEENVSAFAKKLKEVLIGIASVQQPQCKMTILLKEVEQSVTTEEIVAAVSSGPDIKVLKSWEMGRG